MSLYILTFLETNKQNKNMKQEQTIKRGKPVISERIGNAYAMFAVTTHASELLLRELEQLLQEQKVRFKHERKQVINELFQSIKRTKYLYQLLTEECIGMGDGDACGSFDALLNDANTIAALILRFYNATYKNEENGNKIRDFIKGLKSTDLFTEEQITKFEKQI